MSKEFLYTVPTEDGYKYDGMIIIGEDEEDALETAERLDGIYGDIVAEDIHYSENEEIVNSGFTDIEDGERYKDINSHRYSFGQKNLFWYFTNIEKDVIARGDDPELRV